MLKSFQFRYRGSDQTAANLLAHSYSQAVFKLKLVKGAAYIDDALESGLLHFHGAFAVGAQEKFNRLNELGLLWWNR